MNLEQIVDLMSESAARLAKAAKVSKRDERWWAFVAKEDWNLIKLSWALRGLILRRGEGIEEELPMDDQLKKELEEILKKEEG